MSGVETPLEAVLSASGRIPEGSEGPEDLAALERIFWERLDLEIRDAQTRDREIRQTTTEGDQP